MRPTGNWRPKGFLGPLIGSYLRSADEALLGTMICVNDARIVPMGTMICIYDARIVPMGTVICV